MKRSPDPADSIFKTMRNNPHKTRSDEIDEMLAGLRQKMAWTPGWLKAEIDEVIRLEVEKATAERNAR